MNRDLHYLSHIQESLIKIRKYTQDGQQVFIVDSMAQDAVIRNFEIIGEAAKRLSAEIKATEPDIPWRSVAGFRDVLIHDYMGVDVNEVWNVVQDHLPQLCLAIARMLESGKN